MLNNAYQDHYFVVLLVFWREHLLLKTILFISMSVSNSWRSLASALEDFFGSEGFILSL